MGQAGLPYTRDFEDVVAFLAQQMAKTPIRHLMRIAWDSVGDIVTRVVADQLDESRRHGLVLIGVDEIAYRRGQRYLTCVADHERGRIVWAKPGRDARTLQAFFELLGDRRQTIKAISVDMSAGCENAIRALAERDERFCPQVVFDPFHVCQLRQPRRRRRAPRRMEPARQSKTPGGRWIKHSRWSLLKAPERQTEAQLARLAEVAATNKRLYRAFLLKEELRLLYHLPDPRPRRRAPQSMARMGVGGVAAGEVEATACSGPTAMGHFVLGHPERARARAREAIAAEVDPAPALVARRALAFVAYVGRDLAEGERLVAELAELADEHDAVWIALEASALRALAMAARDDVAAGLALAREVPVRAQAWGRRSSSPGRRSCSAWASWAGAPATRRAPPWSAAWRWLGRPIRRCSCR